MLPTGGPGHTLFNRMLRGWLLAALGMGLSILRGGGGADITDDLPVRRSRRGRGRSGRLTSRSCRRACAVRCITTGSNASVSGCGTLFTASRFVRPWAASSTATHRPAAQISGRCDEGRGYRVPAAGETRLSGRLPVRSLTTSGNASVKPIPRRADFLATGVNGGLKDYRFRLRPWPRDLVADGGGNIYGLSGCPLLGVAASAHQTRLRCFGCRPDGAVTTMPFCRRTWSVMGPMPAWCSAPTAGFTAPRAPRAAAPRPISSSRFQPRVRPRRSANSM